MLFHYSLTVEKWIHSRHKINLRECLSKQQISLLNCLFRRMARKCFRVNAPQILVHIGVPQLHQGRLGTENRRACGDLAFFSFSHIFSWHASTGKSLRSVMSMQGKSFSKRCAQKSSRHTVQDRVQVWESTVLSKYHGSDNFTGHNVPFPKIPWVWNIAWQTAWLPEENKMWVLSVPSSTLLPSRKNTKRIHPESPDSWKSCRHSWSGHW